MDAVTRCKLCKAEIFYIKTAKGADMPLNADPLNRYVKSREHGWLFVKSYQPHWETCPEADKFRRKRR